MNLSLRQYQTHSASSSVVTMLVSKMSTSKETGLEDPCYAQTTAGSQHLRTAPTSATSDLPCKSPHQRPQSPYNTSEQPKGPAYWDNLSTLWFTRGALRELDRRNNCSELTQEHHRSVTHQGDNESKQGWKPQFALISSVTVHQAP